MSNTKLFSVYKASEELLGAEAPRQVKTGYFCKLKAVHFSMLRNNLQLPVALTCQQLSKTNQTHQVGIVANWTCSQQDFDGQPRGFSIKLRRDDRRKWRQWTGMLKLNQSLQSRMKRNKWFITHSSCQERNGKIIKTIPKEQNNVWLNIAELWNFSKWKPLK